MLTNNPGINELKYENTITKLSKVKGISLEESAKEIKDIKFSDYLLLIEASADIPGPSGQTLSPNAPAQNPASIPKQTSPNAPSSAKTMWAGKGAPMQAGMTVGINDKTGKPMPAQITQVDQASKGVKVKNPTTGQEEWHNDMDLQPMGQQPMEEQELMRMRQLAGIKEVAVTETFPHDVDHMSGPVIRNADMITDNIHSKDRKEWERAVNSINAKVFNDESEYISNNKGNTISGNGVVWAKWDNATQSGWFNAKGRPVKSYPVKEQGVEEDASCGGTSSGSIAAGPAAVMPRKKRTVEETPAVQNAGRKSVVGDTKSHQASGELSRRLADKNLPTASRQLNGFRR